MFIKSIKLVNIRSYVNQQIDFPDGSVLLSGDIGSGKSTILLAIEFALFGIKRGTYSGTTLLRHGSKNGFVELRFVVNNSDIIVHRTLKTAKDSAVQDSGYIIANDLKSDLTPVELKARILDILGYPKNPLTKNKDLVFRYTVYTPQEEMKKILFEDKETRLDILRRVFGIDRYKNIRENALIATRDIKEEIKSIEGKTYDLEQKKKLLLEQLDKRNDLSKKVFEAAPIVKAYKERELTRKAQLEALEEDIKKLGSYRNQLEILGLELKNLGEKMAVNEDETILLNRQIELLRQETEGEEENYRQQIKDINTLLEQKQSEMMNLNKELAKFLSNKEASARIIERITKIDKCPTCEQKVTDEHKREIFEREERKIFDLSDRIDELRENEKLINQEIMKTRKELDETAKKDRLGEARKVHRAQLFEKKKRLDFLIETQLETKRKTADANENVLVLRDKMKFYADIEENYQNLKKEFEELISKSRTYEIRLAELSKELEGVNRIIFALEEEVKEKERLKEEGRKKKELQYWVEEYFMELMAVMEKHVMARIQREFNDIFKNWFFILIEDETINVQLDDEFTPVIIQNGYETTVDNLSGGEKTSLALAYRLSLNKVINDLIGDIKTKGLIILDEPTDGFSTEQLDKVREVIDELKMKQVIIVSHEPKMETFVDNVIRIRKNEHVSVLE